MSLTHEEYAALQLSVKVAACAVALVSVPAVAVAWVLARRNFPGKALLDAIVHLPLVLPPVVIGYVLLLTLGHNGLDINIAFTWQAAALASAVMGFPLMVRAVRLSMQLTDPRLESAARTLGASPLRVMMTVTLPLALPGVLTGMLLAFARSLGEFGATITFAGNIAGQTRTLPLALYTYTQTPGGDGPAMRIVIICVGVSLIALIVSEWLAARLKRTLGGDHA